MAHVLANLATTEDMSDEASTDVRAILSDPKRLEALEKTDLLDTLPEDSFDRFSRIAARLLDVPVSLVSLVDRDRQFFKSQIGLPESVATRQETPLSHSFCQHVVSRDAPLVIEDAREHPLVKDNLAIRDLDVIAYLGIPLTLSSGHTLGSFCAIQDEPRSWSADEVALMQDLAGAVVSEIELRLTTEALAEARKEAEVANRTKSQFLANMSHELRTPLNAVIGYSEMIREEAEGGLASEEARQQLFADLEQIHSAGEQLLSMVNDVLDISKIEAGEMKLNVSRFDVEEVARDVAETVRPLAERNGNVLEVECPSGLGTMEADVTKLRQSLFNLLGNAAKFTEDGRITLRVRQEEREDGQDGYSFAVEDTGIGMTKEEQETLFEAFAQADASFTREHEGTGLGLVITQSFVEMMGGSIAVESEKGAGSRFTLHLPAEVRTDEEMSLPAAASQSRPPEEDRADPETTDDRRDDSTGRTLVLVIDDDERARGLIERHLHKKGYAVATAADGSEGLAKARRLEPEVITLDVMMPNVDGWAVLSELRKDEALQDIPVVMVTITENEDMGSMLGASDYLTKPLNPERLVTVLSRYHTDNDRCTVLIVEDDDAIRSLLRRTIEGEDGLTACEAKNGQEALECLRQEPPQVILLDLMMPEMDGFSFLEQVQTEPGYDSIPVIVVTAKDLTQEERERLNGRIAAILQKGELDREELLESVSTRIQSVLSNPEH